MEALGTGRGRTRRAAAQSWCSTLRPEQLARTRDAQLAVLCTSLVAWEAVRPLAHEVVAFAGHSLGQVTALVASGALDLEDGVRFAARRAELTQRAADDHPGRMAALLGATVEQAADACAAAPDACWIANDNAPGQVVIAGTAEGVEAAIARAKELGVQARDHAQRRRRVPHPVDASAPPRESRPRCETCNFATPTAPIVANQDGAAYADGDSDGWRARSAEHVTVPVRWRTSMETLAALGADAFVEVGHGSMIAGLAKRTVPDVPVYSCSSPSDLDKPLGGTRIVTVPPGTHTPLPDPPRRSPLAGETLTVPERMIVAPVVGIFRPHADVENVASKASKYRPATRSASSKGRAPRCPVLSPFGGTLMGMLAHPGERLRSGQPIAWLRVA